MPGGAGPWLALGGPRPAPQPLQPVDIGSWQCMPGTPRYKRFFRQPFFDTLAVNRSCVIASCLYRRCRYCSHSMNLARRCRVDQAQRIHQAHQSALLVATGVVDPALRALIHPLGLGSWKGVQRATRRSCRLRRLKERDCFALLAMTHRESRSRFRLRITTLDSRLRGNDRVVRGYNWFAHSKKLSTWYS